YISSADTSLNMTDPLISPFFANERSLKKLPPVLIINSERDILFDQGVEFSKKLDSIGVEVDNVVFPGTVHSFVSAQGQPTALAKAVQLTEYFLSSEI
ncbi:MAG: alpha/beta hydrolase, partial [Muribaculaceae bacterium]|nr:alpha/beta hydrolase [Muribaculaceae bacterium]